MASVVEATAVKHLNGLTSKAAIPNGTNFGAVNGNGTTNSSTVSATDEDTIEEDPFCSSKAAKKISFQDITTAAFMIKGGVEYTTCPRSQLSNELGMEIFLKKEFLQYTGSFKERGARFALLSLTEEQKSRGVISASLGNHAQGLSYHAMLLGIKCTVVMPKAAPMMKIQKCRSYQANVIIHGEDMAESKKHALALSKREQIPYINGYDHPHIIAGQGTIGLEICEQIQNLDAVVIPVGGGGLIAGIAVAIKTMAPHVKIIGVESEKCPSFSEALKLGKPVFTPNKPTLADGLAVPCVGYNAFVTAKPLLDKMIVVREEWIALAILRLVELEKCVVEGAGAAGLAAILGGHLNEFKNKRICLLLCGGNIDTTILGRCLERGLAAEGRLLRFSVTVSDRPGGIADLCKTLAQLGVSIKDIMHERAWIRDIYSVEVKIVCETRDWEHSVEIRKVLEKLYTRVAYHDAPLAINENSN